MLENLQNFRKNAFSKNAFSQKCILEDLEEQPAVALLEGRREARDDRLRDFEKSSNAGLLLWKFTEVAEPTPKSCAQI